MSETRARNTANVATELVDIAIDVVNLDAEKLNLAGGTLTGNLITKNISIEQTSLDAVLNIEGPDSQVKDLRLNVSGSTRYTFRCSGAESGSESGSNFQILSRNDDGSARTNVIFYNRSSDATQLGGLVTNTTANAANVHTNTSGYIYRSTSSIKYKTDVETLRDEYADKLLELRPVWYRSLASVDKSEWSHYGLIAEEVAEIDPRLVHFAENEDGELEPEGVQYDRLVPHLINLVQRQQAQIDALTARLDEAGI